MLSGTMINNCVEVVVRMTLVMIKQDLVQILKAKLLQSYFAKAHHKQKNKGPNITWVLSGSHVSKI